MPPATQVDPGASRAGTRPTRRVLGVFVCRPLILVCRRVPRLREWPFGENAARAIHRRVPGRRPSYILGVTHTEFLETGRQNVETRRAGPLSSSQ